jgi:hypothetical protein
MSAATDERKPPVVVTAVSEDRKPPVTGVTPPQLREAMIRTAWPSLAAYPAGTIGRLLIQSYILAPLGWFLMLPFYFMKVLPMVGLRYVVTNRRVMIQRGWSRSVSGEIALRDIDDIRLINDANSLFFNAGTLELVSKGTVKLKLNGVKEPEVFRHAIRNACLAWAPEKAKEWLKFVPAKAPDAK